MKMKILKSTIVNRQSSIGFTLIELMVSLSIMTIMILGFSNVLSQAQKVVTTSQKTTKANATVAAISQLIRRDFASIQKSGFLAIISGNGANNAPPAIVFTATGNFESRTSSDTATAAVICYTIRKDGTQPVLCREAHLLTTGGPNPWDNNGTSDIANLTLATIEGYSRSTFSDGVLAVLVNNYRTVQTSPTTLAGITSTWPILVAECTKFSVKWMDDGDEGTVGVGSTGTTLIDGTPKTWTTDQWAGCYVRLRPEIANEDFQKITGNGATALTIDGTWQKGNPVSGEKYQILGGAWYGFTQDETDPTGWARHPKDSNWESNSTSKVEWKRSSQAYTAMFDPTTPWPRAVKVEFTIDGIDYEIICPVGP